MRNIQGTLFIIWKEAYFELDTIFPNGTAMFSKAELNNRNSRESISIFEPISREQPSQLLNKYYSSQLESTMDSAVALPNSSHKILLMVSNCQRCICRGDKRYFHVTF